MPFTKLFEAGAVVFERFGDLRDEVIRVSVMLGGSRLDGRKLGAPCCQGSASGNHSQHHSLLIQSSI